MIYNLGISAVLIFQCAWGQSPRQPDAKPDPTIFIGLRFNRSTEESQLLPLERLVQALDALYRPYLMNFSIRINFDKSLRTKYYLVGVEIPINPLIERLNEAAEKDNSMAQRTLLDIKDSGWDIGISDRESIKILEKLSAKGDSRALYELCYCYYTGQGVEEDLGRAFEYASRAAELGDAKACVFLGYAYATGNGPVQDKQLAQKWYLRAAQLGEVAAMAYVSQGYRFGSGFPQNSSESFKWALKAARKGNSFSQCLVGYYYLSGVGTTLDKSAGVYWIAQAAEAGEPWAIARQIQMLATGCGMPKDEDRAKKLLRELESLKLPEVYRELAIVHLYGIVNDTNKQVGLSWLRKACKLEDSYSMHLMGYLYETGYAVSQDPFEAIHWYSQAAKKGDTASMLRIAAIQDDPNSKAYDSLKARAWYEKAAELGDATAPGKLLSLLLNEEDSNYNPTKALELCRNYEQAELYFKLAIHFENGYGVEKNSAAAIDYFLQAAGRGLSEARNILLLKGIDSETIDAAMKHFESDSTYFKTTAWAKNSQATFNREMGTDLSQEIGNRALESFFGMAQLLPRKPKN